MKIQVLALALVASMTVPALAVQPPSRAEFSAFMRTNASDSFECRMMLEGLKVVTNPRSSGEAQWKVTAAASRGCLDDVRAETSNATAQRAPRFMLISSCLWIDSNAENSIVACDGVNVHE